MGVATRLADAPGVDLTSSTPPQNSPDGVRLDLVVEGAADDVLDAVGVARSTLPDGARLQLDAADQ